MHVAKKSYTMKIILITIFFLQFFLLSFGSQKTTVYLFPGQGSDERMFDSLSFDSNINVRHVKYKIPEKGNNLQQYVKTIVSQIDTTEKFILIGVSLGGMICAELNEIINPEKVIIISSAKNNNEMPFRYNFQKICPVYKLIPAKILQICANLVHPLYEHDRMIYRDTFSSMLLSKNPQYFKRTSVMMFKWNRNSNTKDIIQIHGNKDHIIPIRNVKPDYIVNGGSHTMTLTKAYEVNSILNKILENKIENQPSENLLTEN